MNNVRRLPLLVLIACGALGVPSVASSQLPALSDAIIRKLIPVMRGTAGQAVEGKQAYAELDRTTTEYFQLLKDIGAGKVDALAWLKSKSPSVVVPVNAKYEQQVSRWLSSERLMDPVALFSFGMSSPAEVQKIATGKEAASVFLQSGRDPLASPEGKKVKALNDEVARFYAGKGYTGPQQDLFYESTYTSPDHLIVAMFTMTNSFAGSGPGNVGNGPILEIKLNPQPNKAAGPVTPDQVSAGLAKIGMSQEQYEEYVSALMAARKDANDPEGPLLGNGGISPDLPAEIKAEMAKSLSVRKQNAALYKRYARELDPLLDALGA
jgi:hypothetical protein